MSRFEKRIVAFIDVLGLSDALKSRGGQRRYAEAIDSILTSITKDRAHSWLSLRHVLSGEEVEIESSGPFTKGAKVTTVSDAILLSIPFGPRTSPDARMRRIHDCLQAASEIQQTLLKLGLRTRGGISIGGLIHKSHLVVGDGLVKAYQLESQLAIFPRVLIDREIVTLLVKDEMPTVALFRNRIAHLVRQDSDGFYFVDYLSYAPMHGDFTGEDLSNAYHRVKQEISATSSLRVEQKLRWMAHYAMAAMKDWIDRGDRRTNHADEYFTARYYRSNANARDLYDAAMSAKDGQEINRVIADSAST